MEVVPNLTTEAFMKCFRRFTARKGTPRKVISDIAKTFKSAKKVITGILSDLTTKGLLERFHTQWQFNLKRAPWWGGMFERLIGLMKGCLKKTIDEPEFPMMS